MTEYGMGVVSGANADRPLPTSLLSSGVEQQVTLGYGLTDRIEPYIVGQILSPSQPNSAATATFQAGVRWQLTDPASPARFTVATSMFREFTGSLGSAVRGAFTYDWSRVRLGGNLHLEHVFASGRDALDYIAMGGISVKTTSWLRLGGEYVGQDLEESFGAGAEGGPTHFAGPTAAIDLDQGKMQIVGGPAFGLNKISPRTLGRVSLVLAF